MTFSAASLLLFLCLNNATMEFRGCRTSGPAGFGLPETIRQPAIEDCRRRFHTEAAKCIDAVATDESR